MASQNLASGWPVGGAGLFWRWIPVGIVISENQKKPFGLPQRDPGSYGKHPARPAHLEPASVIPWQADFRQGVKLHREATRYSVRAANSAQELILIDSSSLRPSARTF
jgi:hypothetical protein